MLGDEVGYLPGPVSKGNRNGRGCSAKLTDQKLRRVSVWDEGNKTKVVLLTDILDVPAFVIALLYRLRWQIELYLRWMKVLAGFDHLSSQSRNGITIQFYVGVIMALLIHIESGQKRLSKYSLMWVNWIAQDRVTPELMAQALARYDRETELARLRREKKKQANEPWLPYIHDFARAAACAKKSSNHQQALPNIILKCRQQPKSQN